MVYYNERKSRGLKQKLYLVESLNQFEYVIMGSTGNVYNVKIASKPTCTCPDYIINNHRCKHIYFVLLKIMGVVNVDCSTFTENDLKNMISSLPTPQTELCVNSFIKNKYLKLKNNEQIIRGEDDACPICLDDISNGEEYSYCKADCGRCIHTGCFEMWCTKNAPNCLFCKKPWNKLNNTNENGYINLK